MLLWELSAFLLSCIKLSPVYRNTDCFCVCVETVDSACILFSCPMFLRAAALDLDISKHVFLFDKLDWASARMPLGIDHYRISVIECGPFVTEFRSVHLSADLADPDERDI